MGRGIRIPQPNALLRWLSVVSIVAIMMLATWASPRANASQHTNKQANAGFTVTVPAPKVPDAAADKKYAGQSITFYGSSVGSGSITDAIAAKEFTKDTGIKVKVVPEPQSTTDLYAALQRFFTGHSSAIDDVQIDVVYPGTFAPYLVDLKKPLASNVKLDFPSIVKNDTIGGHLVGAPMFTDFGMLYYRTDLLKKYGYKAPPTTWTQMTAMAKKIQAGEQKTNKNFHGFLFQGASYEGLTCDALEWIASYGGGSIVEHNGKVSINNSKAADALKLAQSWVGTISPRGVTTYKEEDARNAFQAGDAAFMRNWPYAYALLAAKTSSKVAGKFGVSALPHGAGGKSSAAVGGWQIGVNKYSNHVAAAIAFAKYYSGKEMQAWFAQVRSNAPAMPSVWKVPAVAKAMPFLKTVYGHVNMVTRPSAGLGAKYNQGSTIFYQGVSEILLGQSVNTYLQSIQQQLQNLTR